MKIFAEELIDSNAELSPPNTMMVFMCRPVIENSGIKDITINPMFKGVKQIIKSVDSITTILATL